MLWFGAPSRCNYDLQEARLSTQNPREGTPGPNPLGRRCRPPCPWSLPGICWQAVSFLEGRLRSQDATSSGPVPTPRSQSQSCSRWKAGGYRAMVLGLQTIGVELVGVPTGPGSDDVLRQR